MQRILLTSLALIAASAAWLALDGDRPAQAGPPESEHERIVRFWTPDRIANARPRDLVVDAHGQHTVAKGGPAAGGGSGGGGSACASLTVGGATWNCGGAVAQTTGKVYFTLGSAGYVCSGSVVYDGNQAANDTNKKSLVLTAGHCTLDDVTDLFAGNWMFIPAYQDGGSFSSCGATRFGCWTASGLVTTTSFRDGSLNADYAFAIVGSGGKANSQLDVAVGSQPIAFDTAPGTQVSAFGYPAAGKYKGRALVFCAGTSFADPYGSTDVGVGCNMTGGSSGGPWFRDFNHTAGTGTLTSVNSFFYYSVANVMFGPKFDAYTQKTLNVATSLEGGYTLVTPGP